MFLSYIVISLIYVNEVFSSRLFFRGHSVGYGTPPPPPKNLESTTDIITDYITQRLDHFDPTNKALWSQRYFINTEYYNTTSRNAIFLMISGEDEASEYWMTQGAWVATAEMYGALLLQLEHRFYGESQPVTDLSVENLRFVSSRQALEDIATFIAIMNEQYSTAQDAKWIVFGGSYAGSLAAWLKEKYPYLVQGVMAASAPVFVKLEYPEYMDVVAADLASSSNECVDAVRTAFAQLESFIDSNDENENITALFNLCVNFDEVRSDADIVTFLEILTDSFSYIAQYNKNYGSTTTVDDLCDIMVNEAYGDEVHRLSEVTKFFYGSDCLDYRYQNTVDLLKDTTIEAGKVARQWMFQPCTEFGSFQSSNQEDQVFGTKFTAEHYAQLCEDAYGPEFNITFIQEQVDATNTYYGGYNIDVRNVVFVHGSFDPWHPVGLSETTNPESPVIMIEGAAHCANMYNTFEGESPELTAAKAEVNRLIGVWLDGDVASSTT